MEISSLAETYPGKGTSIDGMLQAIEKIGLYGKAVKTNISGITKSPYNMILLLDTGENNHFAIYDKIEDDQVFLVDGGNINSLPINQFESIWKGYTILIWDEPIDLQRSYEHGMGLMVIFIGLLLMVAYFVKIFVALRAGCEKSSVLKILLFDKLRSKEEN